jgi:hypothetical protein
MAERAESGRERRQGTGDKEEPEEVRDGEGRMKAQSRNDRRWSGTASKEKPGRTGCVAGKEIVIRPGAKVNVAPLSVKAPTEMRLMGASGA